MSLLHHLAVYTTTGILMSVGQSWSREWTSKAGTTIEADLVRVHLDNAILKKKDGKELVVPIAKLSDDDQQFLTERATSKALARTSDITILKELEGNLVKIEDGEVKESNFKNPTAIKYLAVYFSAQWSGPCRTFTRDLVHFYNATKETHPELELVFVSSDRSADEWETYMVKEQMPWYSIQFKKTAMSKLKEYRGPGTPCLVLMTPDGEILSDSYVDGQYVGPKKVIADLEVLLRKNSPIAESARTELHKVKP